MIEQGDIIKLDLYPNPIVVLSKKMYNQSGKVLGCPLQSDSSNTTFELELTCDDVTFYAQTDDIRKIDIKSNKVQQIGNISLGKQIIMADMVQSILEPELFDK